MSDSHSDSKWAKTALRIWSYDDWTDSVLQYLWQSLNWGNSSTEDRWAADMSMCETSTWMKGQNEHFYGFSL